MADSPIRVVLADDDMLSRPLLSELLVSMGYAVVGEAGTGREAIAVAAEVVPDVVLLDVHMPDGSGIDGAKQSPRPARRPPWSSSVATRP